MTQDLDPTEGCMKSSQEELGSLLDMSGKAQDKNPRLCQLRGHKLLQSQFWKTWQLGMAGWECSTGFPEFRQSCLQLLLHKNCVGCLREFKL